MTQGNHSDDKSLVDAFLEATRDLGPKEAGEAIGQSGEQIRKLRGGERPRLHAKTRRAMTRVVEGTVRPLVQGAKGTVAPPSDRTLMELREWIDSVLLPTSRDEGAQASAHSAEQMAAKLRADGWTVYRRPPGRGGAGAP